MSSIILNQKPRFISFEGVEGVGKTTLLANLAKVLQQRQIDFITTREPGGSVFAENLRQILLDPTQKMVDDSELLLIFAARCDHLQTVILPALAQGQWVLCDRFIDSTLAYQGFGRYQHCPQMLQKIDLLIQHFLPKLPDVSLLLDLPLEQGLQRAKNRSAADRFEQENLAFFQRVYQGFQYSADQYPNRIKKIDASGSPEQVLQRALVVLGLAD